MGPLRLVDVCAADWEYLRRAHGGPWRKARLAAVGLRLFVKSALTGGRRGPVEERLMGLRVAAFSTRMLRFFFREVFIHQDYDFDAGREDPLILDCGANVGMATLFFTWRYPKAEVHAFEPDPGTFALLKRNLEQNRLTRALAHRAAVCGRSGPVSLFRDESDPGSPTMSTVRGRMPKDSTTVEGITLSEFMDQSLPGRDVDLLKLDVEGAEASVIGELAASGRIARVRTIIVEYHHHIGEEGSKLGSFLGILEEAGFCYQLRASAAPRAGPGGFQDILLYCRRKG